MSEAFAFELFWHCSNTGIDALAIAFAHVRFEFEERLQLRAGVHIAATIEHDSWCGIYGGAACKRVPNITVTRCRDGEVVVIDELGRGRCERKQWGVKP